MTDSEDRSTLREAIEGAYQAFASYRNANLKPAEPFELADLPRLQEVRDNLTAKQLDALIPKDLLDYFYLAIDHIGDADDFRHFLPKILDAMTERAPSVLIPAHLPSLLKSAGAGLWPSSERKSLAVFAEAAERANVLSRKVAAEILRILQ
jgi:hypothetical protein